LIKNPQILVNFIGFLFKHLPKNRKQLKLLSFITQTIKIVCEQRPEILGFKLQIKGRLNRRGRTKTYVNKNGILAIQTHATRVEYGYSSGFTRSGLIGIKV
jgi:ribosomal protein S3